VTQSLLSTMLPILDRLGVSAVLIGGSALAIRGVARSSLNQDLFTLEERCLFPPTWARLRSDGIQVEVRHGDDGDPLAGAVRFEQKRHRPLHLIVGRDASWQQRILDRAESLTLNDGPVRVALSRDLVLLKLFASGPQDAWDIAQLLQLPHADTLREDVNAEVQLLPDDSQRLWDRIVRDVFAPTL